MRRTRGRAAALFAWAIIISTPAIAGPEEDVRTAFNRFIAAQNAHDLQAVGDLLSRGPEFVWITRGSVIRGRTAALRRFDELYRGTWKLRLVGPIETFVIEPDTIQLIAPVNFTIGKADAAPVESRFILTQLWHRQRGGWRLASLLPIPSPAN
jgi:ketosteroid isomerase-like protein